MSKNAKKKLKNSKKELKGSRVIYTILDRDDTIEKQCDKWEKKNSISVDFECEYNLHIYGEHLCLIQIYDGEGFFLIDPRSKLVTPSSLIRFFSLETEKLWFDIQGDASLIYKKYHAKINNVFDVRVPALLLGFTGNLLSLEKEFLGLDIQINKKKNQTANWLKRPLDGENIEYALLDVKYLFDLKKALLLEIEKKGLLEECNSLLEKVRVVKEPKPGWQHISGWERMNREEKGYAKAIYLARDKIAKRFNVPPNRVLEKHNLLSLIYNPPQRYEELELRLKKESQRFRSFLLENLWPIFSHRL